ncbi:hypothetical protein [uncultured Microbacterium sp.]|uniref:hypothetical protein n=1 Tax=uncultured Microbacterium sp. TaxID=191216 RepID=UPI0026280F0D|nr:hypothetical protein [uncultured Microbacterium sp.]
MPSGGARARSGPAPDPNSFRSMDREWVELPAGGFAGEVPEFPLPRAIQFSTFFEDGKKVTEKDDDETASVWDAELELWAELWSKPQAAAWSSLGLKFQVAAYVRAFLESVKADAVSGMKTAVLRMETELGLSIAGMRSNGWRISDGTAAAPASASPAARKTSSGDWLKAVSVEGA